MTRFTAVLAYGVTVLLAGYGLAWAHSVAQVQTTKFFTPETVQLLKDRATAGTPGFQVGDTVSYIIQFTPVENSSNSPSGQSYWGTNGYITDYIPSGTQVVGAWIVSKDGSGNYNQIPPSLPGGIDDGWGIIGGTDSTQQTYNAPFSTNAYDPTGRCAAAGKTNNCNSRLTAHVADTGIFYSTDPRTAQYPPLPTRILQGTNGYYVNTSGATQLNPIIGQTNATVHNLWDADQANAFGTATLPTNNPHSGQGMLMPSVGGVGPGTGAPPYFAGSPVAGSQTGYQLDCTGSVGPWQRIAYSGSRIGDASTGPATTNGSSLTAVNGSYTTTGWDLSSSNPLPAGTNAVRWAIGELSVGEMRYVKISLKLTSPVPSGGLINGSEVYGGDTAGSDDGGHNTWRYMVPSVADNNSNLFVLKTIACVYSGGTCTTAINGDFILANSKLRYRVIYLNAGNATQTGVNLTDTLPCQTAANSVNNINYLSGPFNSPTGTPAIGAGTNATNCTSAGRRTLLFGPSSTLGPGEGGTIEYDVQTNAAANSMVPNTATLYSSATSSVTSNVNSYVQTQADLSISKTVSVSSVSSGGTVTYTLTVQNSGTANATNVNVYDILPTSGGTGTTARFSFVTGSSVFSGPITPVTPARTTPPALTPYNTGANQEQVLWNFGAQTLAPGASFTISFSATVGAGVPASATPYYNTAAVLYTYTGSVGTPRIDTINVAGVTVTSTLSVAKSIDCYYSGGSCISYNGVIPAGANVRYRIDYSNTGGSSVANATLSDTLPCQTGAAPVSYNGAANTVNFISGPITTIPAATLSSIATGSCGAGTRRTFSFPATTINTGQTGVIKYDVQTNATITTGTVINTATLTSASTTTVTSDVQTTVETVKGLSISKTASATTIYSGQTITYTLTISSTGTATATNLKVYDWLPTSSPTLSVPTRFSFAIGSSSFSGMASGTTTSTIPPVQTPYNTGANAANQQEVAWDFGASTLAPGASFSITFGATVGSAVTASTYYTNNARVVSGGTSTVSSDANGVSVYLLSAATPTVDVSVAKTNNNVFLASNATTTYTITVVNNGPNAANNSVVRDVAAAGLTKTGVTCSANGLASCPTGTWLSVSALEGGTGIIIPTLSNGGQITLTVPATVTATSGYVTNAATVSAPSSLTDTNYANNTASATNLVMLMPQFTTVKSSVTSSDPYNGMVNPKAVPGATKTYSITVTNNGAGTADTNSIFVADAMPANMTAIAGSAVLQAGGDPNITGITATYTNVPYNATTHPTDSNFCSSSNKYTPPANGADPNITGICIAPIGQLSATNGTFTVKFDAQVN